MKKMKLTTMCLLAALFAAVGSVSAQEKSRDYSEQKLKVRAEMMALNVAEKYGLDEKQVEQLTEANVEWLRQQGDAPAWHRPGEGARRWADRRHHRPARRGGCCGEPRRHYDDCCGAYCEDGHRAPDCPYQADGRCPQLSPEEREKLQAERKQAVEKWRVAREAYDKKLQEIMTDEQYKAYKESRRGFRRR